MIYIFTKKILLQIDLRLQAIQNISSHNKDTINW